MPAGAAVPRGRGQGTWGEAAATRCLFRGLGESEGNAGATVPPPTRLDCVYPAPRPIGCRGPTDPSALNSSQLG